MATSLKEQRRIARKALGYAVALNRGYDTIQTESKKANVTPKAARNLYLLSIGKLAEKT